MGPRRDVAYQKTLHVVVERIARSRCEHHSSWISVPSFASRTRGRSNSWGSPPRKMRDGAFPPRRRLVPGLRDQGVPTSFSSSARTRS